MSFDPSGVTSFSMGARNALVQAIGMPEDELFNLVSEYNANDFVYSRTF